MCTIWAQLFSSLTIVSDLGQDIKRVCSFRRFLNGVIFSFTQILRGVTNKNLHTCVVLTYIKAKYLVK